MEIKYVSLSITPLDFKMFLIVETADAFVHSLKQNRTEHT